MNRSIHLLFMSSIVLTNLLLTLAEPSNSKPMLKAGKLRPGSYYQKGSKYIKIIGSDGNYCYEGASKHGTSLMSLIRDPKNPNIYKILGWGVTSIRQQSRDVLLFADREEYRYDGDIDNRNLAPDEKACLKSKGSYKKSSPIGIYGRDSSK